MRFRHSAAHLLAAAVASGSAAVTGADQTQPLHIDSTEQLFMDDWLLASTENVTRRVNRATKHPEPVIVPDRHGEGTLLLLYGSVLFDQEEQRFKAWYYASGHVAYATSKDGVKWEKPDLDVYLSGGKPANLLLRRGDSRSGCLLELLGVCKDHFDPDPARRYKMAFVSLQRDYKGERYRGQFHSGQRRGLGTAVSPDGIHWTVENNFATTDICDTSRFFQDPETGRFVLFGRTKLTPDQNDGRWRISGWGRAVNRMESEDFRTWSDPELVLAADAADPEGLEVYAVSAFPYEGVTVGLIQVFHAPPGDFGLDIQLGISRDGKHFTRATPREPFITEGQVGSWDRFNISVGNLPPVTVGDEMWFYYSGRTRRHSPYADADNGPKTGRIGLARIKRGRFVALEASFAAGTVLTHPLVFAGNALSVNANARFGSIDISLLDADGTELSTGTIKGADGIRLMAPPKGKTMAELAGQPVSLRFALRNAQLFGFRIERP